MLHNPLLEKIENNNLTFSNESCVQSDGRNNDEINKLKNKLKNIYKKKTFIFNYYDNKDKINETPNNKECEMFCDKKYSCMYNVSLNEHFNDTHKLCIGEIENIPKYILSIADYIFFDSKENINKYLESYAHFLRVGSSNASLYLIDKCNYEYYQLFHFNKHLSSI